MSELRKPVVTTRASVERSKAIAAMFAPKPKTAKKPAKARKPKKPAAKP